MSRSASRILVFAAGFALLCSVAGPAAAEQNGRNGLAVSLDGHISPDILPRRTPAPVSVFLAGGAYATDGTTPPRLRRIEIAFAGSGGLDVAGLPACPGGRLRNATWDQALARCRGALVGRGWIRAEVPFKADAPLVARSRAVAFNAVKDGRPAVWVYAYSALPPVSFVLPFTVRTLHRGAYGVALSAPVAHTLGPWPRLRSFELTLGRRFRSHGERHSYLSGYCPLPRRFHHLDVPFARASYYFVSAPAIQVSISRPCKVLE